MQGIEIVDRGSLEVACPPEKRARTKRCTRSRKVITRSAKESSEGRHLERCTKTSKIKPPGAADCIKKMTDKAKKNTGKHVTKPKSRF